MNKIVEKRRRFGYRRIGIMLERVGLMMNEKQFYRIYRIEGLSVRGSRANAGAAAPEPIVVVGPSPWSLGPAA